VVRVAAPPLGGLAPEAFLRQYWQQRPLLIRNAIPDFRNPIDPDELAGLACEPGVRSRIVLGHPDRRDWSVEYGPFAVERFGQLPDTAWTLLVSEIEHYWPEGPEWLHRFDFIPRWRRDDLMISYAARDGSVGPHIDAYDVFLFQAQGRRRWQIQEPPPRSPICLPALPLAILRTFEATSEWVLEPGDMLYLPPGIPHLGLSLDDDCMTWSIGFRAPAWRDLVGAFLEDRLESVEPERFVDPGREMSVNTHEIPAGDLDALRSGLLERLRLKPTDLDRFLGEFLSRPEQEPLPEDESAANEEGKPADLGSATRYRFDPDLKRYWIQSDSGIILFVAGQSLAASELSAAIAESFCSAETVVPDDWTTVLPALAPVLKDLLTRGLLERDD
jgi:50S ribosomal protein L16 3-hydroxylase